METKNFTKKEALLVNLYELVNELDILEGKESRYNIEGMVGTWKFQKEADNSRVADLQEKVENYKGLIEKQKAENEKKAQTEAYWETEEGKARKAELEAKKEALSLSYTTLHNTGLDMMKAWIKQFLGEHWTVRYMNEHTIDFQMWDAEKAEFIFGSEIEVSAEKDCWFKKGERFETNIGAMGSFDINNLEVGARARFYIDLGKFLGDQDKMNTLKNLMFFYAERVESLRQEMEKVCNEIGNPLGL